MHVIRPHEHELGLLSLFVSSLRKEHALLPRFFKPTLRHSNSLRRQLFSKQSSEVKALSRKSFLLDLRINARVLSCRTVRGIVPEGFVPFVEGLCSHDNHLLVRTLVPRRGEGRWAYTLEHAFVACLLRGISGPDDPECLFCIIIVL